MAEWTSVKLDALGTVERGRSRHRPRNDPALYGGPYPFFQTGDIKAAGLWLTEFSQSYNEAGLAQSRLWDPGTLCITIAANIAESAILAIPGCFPDSVVGFLPDPAAADVRFVKYLLDTTKLRMQAISRGTTQDNLSVDKLVSFDLEVPPLREQHKIAAVLAAYDELIENNLGRIEILEEMVHAVYREWFVDFRFPGHEDVALVDSPLGPIPEGWRASAMKDICSRIQAGSTPARSNPDLWDEDGIDWYKTGELQDGFLLGSDEHVSQNGPIRTFEPGTTLMAIYGSPTVGRMGIVVHRASANQAALGLVPDDENLGPILLFYLLLDRRAHFNAIAQGAAQQNISKVKVESTEVLLPSRDVASTFEELVQSHWNLRLNLARQNANLRATRGILLPKLVSGEIDVSDLDIEREWLAS